MKKVLILAYDFPPFVSVGGLRPYNWLKYFKEFDIEPIVVTRQWEVSFVSEMDYIKPSRSKSTVIEKNDFGTIVKAAYSPNFPNRLYLKYGESRFRFVRKACSLFFEIAQYYWNTGPKKSIYVAADTFLQTNKVDVIIATGDPFVLFHYASKLSEKHATPWIADYRDPWSYDLALEKKQLLKLVIRKIEKRTIKNTSLITTVTSMFSNNLRKITQKRIEILPNGYDPEIINSLCQLTPQNETLTIGFIGSLYKWNPIESFLSVVNKFIQKNGDSSLKINLYGVNTKKEIKEIIKNKFPLLKTVVNITPRMTNEKVLELASHSDLLLLFNYYAIIGTKIYDYIGLKRPILLCYSNDSEANKLRDKYYTMPDFKGVNNSIQQEVIEDKDAGYIAENSVHLYEILENRFAEFKANGYLKCNTKKSEEFSRKHQTGKLAELIEEIVV